MKKIILFLLIFLVAPFSVYAENQTCIVKFYYEEPSPGFTTNWTWTLNPGTEYSYNKGGSYYGTEQGAVFAIGSAWRITVNEQGEAIDATQLGTIPGAYYAVRGPHDGYRVLPSGGYILNFAQLKNSGYMVCPDPCVEKQGQSNYNLEAHIQSSKPSTENKCYENCQQSTEILWEDCINDSCVSSMKFTYTGAKCSTEPVLSDVDGTPPNRCNDELDAKIAACGGSLNVQSFDFESCTGVCAPDDCHSAWTAKIQQCGGIMAVSTWDSETCTGTCVSDPFPTTTNPPDGVSPGQIQTGNTENPDGTSSTTTTTSYNYLGTEYTETKTTTYDSQGNPIGTTVSTTKTGQNSDIEKKQLAALEGIKDKLDELTDGETPNLPAQPEYDGTIPDLKNWTEYNNAQQVGEAKANREIAIMEQQTVPDAFSIELDTSGSTPYLHGPMFGKEIYIRFDRPWMITGYQIMNATLIGIGYLQAAMMVHRVVTGA